MPTWRSLEPVNVASKRLADQLLRRIYLDDLLSCPCGGRRYVVAEINERDAIVAILDHLGLDADPPTIARARESVGESSVV